MYRLARRLTGLAPLAAVLGLLLAPTAAVGQLKTYYSLDAGESPTGPRTNYNPEVKQFKGDTGAFNVITFEGLPTGPWSDPNALSAPANAKLFPGQGVKVDLNGFDPRVPSPDPKPYVYGVTSDHQDQYLGFDTTTNNGTGQFLRVVPFLQANGKADVTFEMPTPVSAFGFAVTGLGGQVPGSLHLLFQPNGGAPQDLTITGDLKGGLVFYGVTNFPGQTQYFTLEMRGVTSTVRDIIGIDDVRWAAVPEPTSIGLLALGVVVVLAARRVRERPAG